MIRISKDEYDKLKRAEIALELVFINTYKSGCIGYVDSGTEQALGLVYGKEIAQLKAVADTEKWRNNDDTNDVINELTRGDDDDIS